MAFPSRVVRTYGRHKKRTITANAWISPESDVKAQHIFSSPESCSFTTSNTSTSQTNSSDDKHKSSITEISSDDDWVPGKKVIQRTKKTLKESSSNVNSKRALSKPPTKKSTSRKQANGKENLVESKELVKDLPPTAGGKKQTKLSRKGRGKADVKGQENGENEVKPGSRKPKNVLARFDVTHSPIKRSSRLSSRKRGRTESSDFTFNMSCDLFSYSADVSYASSCSSDKAEADDAMKTSDDIVFGSPVVFPCPGQEGRVETSTPNVTKYLGAKTNQLNESAVLPSARRITRSSVTKNGIRGTRNATTDNGTETKTPVSNSNGANQRDCHAANCKCGTCKMRHLKTPDLFDLSNEISFLDISNSCNADDKPHNVRCHQIKGNHATSNERGVIPVERIISPCSVVVTPLSETCLSQCSNFSVSKMSSHHEEDPVQDDDKDDDVLLSSYESEEAVDPEERLCSENQALSDSYRHAHSFKEVLTPVKSRSTGRLVTAREKVLQQCNQESLISFSQCIPTAVMKSCVKIGEGVYGEVYRTVNTRDETVALKVIPIEGDFEVNSEPQKSFEEILPEIVISRELSALCDSGLNMTSGFIQVNHVSCCQGSYPKMLLAQWDEYNTRKGSENDRPDLYPDDQLFIVFEFADGGVDLESLRLESVHQAVSILQQVAVSLAVAEQALEFEHRDLHWGNILVLPTSKKTICFQLEGDEVKVESHGVQAGMIDFTLSRLKKDDCTVYCDLTNDETLFTGRGDLQFEMYRKMRDENDNDWEAFNPHTNVLWLHYLLNKLLKSKTYPRVKSDPTQRSLLRELRSLGRHLLGHTSTEDVVRESELLELGGD